MSNYAIIKHHSTEEFKVTTKAEFTKANNLKSDLFWSHLNDLCNLRGEAEIKLRIKKIDELSKMIHDTTTTKKTFNDTILEISRLQNEIESITPENYPEWFI